MADPYTDPTPSRYSLESDEEEDEYNPVPTTNPGAVKLAAQMTYNHQRCQKLVVAIGEAGRSWTRGVNLGEQTGLVTLNAVPVGFLFNPPWTQTTILVSEVTTKLPLWAMHRYAEFVIISLKPTSLAFLDSYTYPTYISAEIQSSDQPFVRYLTSGNDSSSLGPLAQSFASPNLITSTTASFLSILSLHASNHNSPNFTVILLPFPHSPPSPRELATANVSFTDSFWPKELMLVAHRYLFIAVAGVYIAWAFENGDARNCLTSEKRSLGEQGMYL